MKPLRICESCGLPCKGGHVDVKGRILCFECAKKAQDLSMRNAQYVHKEYGWELREVGDGTIRIKPIREGREGK